jgi:hypothetical protein
MLVEGAPGIYRLLQRHSSQEVKNTMSMDRLQAITRWFAVQVPGAAAAETSGAQKPQSSHALCTQCRTQSRSCCCCCLRIAYQTSYAAAASVWLHSFLADSNCKIPVQFLTCSFTLAMLLLCRKKAAWLGHTQTALHRPHLQLQA